VENSDDNVEISRNFASIRYNIKTLAKGILGNSELKQHKTMKIIRLKKEAKLQWLQNPMEII
jgi:hypothetical protein